MHFRWFVKFLNIKKEENGKTIPRNYFGEFPALLIIPRGISNFEISGSTNLRYNAHTMTRHFTR